jgi:hypothetical protein
MISVDLIPIELLNGGGPPVQDFVILNGIRSPGVCQIVNAGSPRKWDRQGGYGYSGASLVFTGTDLSDFDILIDLFEKKHWSDWNIFARLLDKEPLGVKPRTLDISHPLLYRAPLRITQCVVRDVTQFTQGTGSAAGRWTVRIPMTSWRKPQAALGKPVGSIPRAGTGIADFTKDPEIAALMAKQAALGGAL